jgi:V-type H+-transporting ATPase subunit E
MSDPSSQNLAQINQMISFILNEAKEKSEEIDARTLEDYNIQKLKFLQQFKEKFTKDLALKKEKQIIQLKIQRSTQLNQKRLTVIDERNQVLLKTADSVKDKLAKLVDDKAKYKQLMVRLILEGAKILNDETDIGILCKESDKSLIEDLIKSNSVKKDGVKFFVDTSVYYKVTNESNIGGVVLTCKNGAIRVDNTLSTRLSQILEKDKPSIRKLLFPQEASPVVAN